MSETDRDFRDALSDHAYKVLAGSALMLLAMGTVAYRILEDWSWVDAFYFSAVAVATVGFGDLTPTGDGSKLFTVAYIFTGIGLITTYFNARTRRQASRQASRRASRLQDVSDDPAETDEP